MNTSTAIPANLAENIALNVNNLQALSKYELQCLYEQENAPEKCNKTINSFTLRQRIEEKRKYRAGEQRIADAIKQREADRQLRLAQRAANIEARGLNVQLTEAVDDVHYRLDLFAKSRYSLQVGSDEHYMACLAKVSLRKIKAFPAVKEKFIDSLDANPVNGLFFSGDFFATSAQYVVAQEAVQALEGGWSKADWLTYVREQVCASSRNWKSSSQAHNLMSCALTEAWAEKFRDNQF